MIPRRLLPLVIGVVSTGCAPEPPPFEPVADVAQMMNMVLEPAGEVYWDAVGWILDENGTTEIRPETDEEWDATRNAAMVIAESGNLLMMEGRALDDEAWITYSQALVEVGRRAAEVAEARDEQGVFDVGAEVYYVCTACHANYALETLRPTDERSEAAAEADPGNQDVP